MRYAILDPEDRDAEVAKRLKTCASYGPFKDHMARSNPISREFKRLSPASFRDSTIVLRYRTTSREIAAVIVDDIRDVDPRDVLVRKRGSDSPIRVSTLADCYEPLRYPCLLPHLDRSWWLELKKKTGLSDRRWEATSLNFSCRLQA